MPAPVSNTVLSLVLCCCCGVDVKNSVKAAIAPETEAAAEGMMVGAGKGAVYGIRISCPPIFKYLPLLFFHTRQLLLEYLCWEGFSMLFGIGLDKGLIDVIDLFRPHSALGARVAPFQYTNLSTLPSSCPFF